MIVLQSSSKIFLILRRLLHHIITNIDVIFVKKTYHSSHFLFELEFPQQSFEKSFNIKLHGNPSNETRKVRQTRGQRDRHMERETDTWTDIND